MIWPMIFATLSTVVRFLPAKGTPSEPFQDGFS